MSSSMDELRLNVLFALISQYGPIPCINVRQHQQTLMIQMQQGLLDPEVRDYAILYCLEASELRLREGDGAIILARCRATNLPEPTEFRDHRAATERRDLLCELLTRIPWNHTTLYLSLSPADAAKVLCQISTGPDGVVILPIKADEISAKERN